MMSKDVGSSIICQQRQHCEQFRPFRGAGRVGDGQDYRKGVDDRKLGGAMCPAVCHVLPMRD